MLHSTKDNYVSISLLEGCMQRMCFLQLFPKTLPDHSCHIPYFSLVASEPSSMSHVVSQYHPTFSVSPLFSGPLSLPSGPLTLPS